MYYIHSGGKATSFFMKSQASKANCQETVKNQAVARNHLQGIHKPFDLEERTYQFARDVAQYCSTLARTVVNHEFQRQLIRASGSVGANYIEARESLGKKDFVLRLKISRKEAKESAYWLRLLLSANIAATGQQGKRLLDEAMELKYILSAIIEKSK